MGKVVVLSFLLLACAWARAQTSERLQNNDLALTGGGQFAFSNPLDLGAAWALEGTFAHALLSVPLMSLSADCQLPVRSIHPFPPSTVCGWRAATMLCSSLLECGCGWLRRFRSRPICRPGSGMRVSIGSTSMGLPAPVVRWLSILVAGSI